MTLSAKELAIKLGTDARTVRKFLRETTPKEDQPGQGGRWNIEPKQVKKLQTRFDDWVKPSVTEQEDEMQEEDIDYNDDEHDEDNDPIEPDDDELEEIEEEDEDLDIEEL